MAKLAPITVELARQLLDYDAHTGILRWKRRPLEMFEDKGHSAAHTCGKWNTKWAGKEAGGKDKNGYLILRVAKVSIKCHRIAWAIHYGEWPKADLDHINRDPADNRIENLREVTHAENMQNKGMSDFNTSGSTGVFYQERATRRPWFAQIKIKRKTVYLGSFALKADAEAAYEKARAELHPYFNADCDAA